MASRVVNSSAGNRYKYTPTARPMATCRTNFWRGRSPTLLARVTLR